jgi:hypothetical protein
VKQCFEVDTAFRIFPLMAVKAVLRDQGVGSVIGCNHGRPVAVQRKPESDEDQ